MKIRARRGVCIGVDRHLQAGDLADLDAAQVTFLVGIGAVEVVHDEPTGPEQASAEKGADSTVLPPQPEMGKKKK